jgi:Endoglucanase Y
MVALRKATRALSIIGFLCVLMSCTTKDDSEFKAQFMAYKALFIDGGRVIDTGNGDVSHSEGQGYGMLFAIAADDKATFDALWQWTKSTLMRKDGLLVGDIDRVPAARLLVLMILTMPLMEIY